MEEEEKRRKKKEEREERRNEKKKKKNHSEEEGKGGKGLAFSWMWNIRLYLEASSGVACGERSGASSSVELNIWTHNLLL